MTPAEAASALCIRAKLHVLSVEACPRSVTVTVARKDVPASASGLAGLTARLGVGVAVGFGDRTGDVTLTFRAEDLAPTSGA